MLSARPREGPEAVLETNDTRLFSDLGVRGLGTQLSKNSEVAKGKGKVEVLTHILENCQSCVLSPGVGPEPLSAGRWTVHGLGGRRSGRLRWSGHWVGCQYL